MKRLRIGLLLITLFLLACNIYLHAQVPATKSVFGHEQPAKNKQETYAKNIILMIGDGMGLSQITAAFYRNGRRLNLQKFPYTGLTKTHAADNLVTDSAAGATAFAIGEKANYQDVGVTQSGKQKETILEEAERRGKATGLVVTSTIIHATPAAFFAHNDYRYNYPEIAPWLVKSGVDFFVGGGKKWFDRRDDERDLIKELKENGYFISDYFQEDLENVELPQDQKFGFFTADDDPIPVVNGRDYLPVATEMALSFLPGVSDEGFFLMVEGSQIDWGGHANNAEYIIAEMLEFDRIVGEVLEFAKQDGETLLIVISDHETGGLCITPESTMEKLHFSFTTDKHTAAMVPVFAYGPGAERFQGTYENYMIYHKMRAAFAFDRDPAN